MAGVPFIFGNATTSIPLSNLDADFNTGLTIGNTTVGLGNTVTTLGNVTLTNTTISSPSGVVANAVIYSNASGNLTGNVSLISFNGTNLGIGNTSPTQSWTGGSAKVAQLQSTSIPTVFRINDSSGTYGDLQLVSSGSAEVGVYNFGNGAMRFGTNGTEWMRILSSGDVCIGRTTSQGKLAVERDNADWCYNSNQTGTGTKNHFRFTDTSSVAGTITSLGSTTYYNTSSDYRLKEDVAPMTGALATVAQLKPVTYKWKADGSNGQGFIAHELQEVVPDCVTGEKDAMETYKDDDGVEQTRIKPQGIDTSFLVATLTSAIQELKIIVDAQATQIVELQAKVGV